MSTPADAVRRFRAAVEAGDTQEAVAQLHPDVRFHSPVVHRTYEGRDAVAPVLWAVEQVFEDFRYVGEYAAVEGGPAGHVLRFRARIGDREVEGIDLLETGPDGLVVDFTVMTRPYSATTALRERMAALLAASVSVETSSASPATNSTTSDRIAQR